MVGKIGCYRLYVYVPTKLYECLCRIVGEYFMKKQTYLHGLKLLALDLDGTTMRSDNTLSYEVKTAIQKACKSGIEVVVASGRPYGSMPKEILEIKEINYVISSNGASIHDKTGKILKSYLLDENDVLKFLKITQEYDIILEAFINGKTYTDRRYAENPIKYGCTEAYLGYVQANHGKIYDMRAFIYEHRNELDSIEYVCTEKNLREKIRHQVEENINGFYVTSSSENFVEMMDKSATKGNAVKWLCDYLKIDLKATCACGNADNDIDMIKLAGLGASVKNATPLCLKSADIIVESNDENGVSKLVELLINEKMYKLF